MHRPKLSYANIVATLALFIALGGGAYAASQLPKNSVGSKQLKNNSVTGAKVRDGSITGQDVDAGTIGVVPSSAHAITADDATRATTADSASSANHAMSASKAADSAKLGGHSPNEFMTPLLGYVKNVEEATNAQTSWGSITGLSEASPSTTDVDMVTPYYSTLFASGFTVSSEHPIGGGGHVGIHLAVNGEATELGCAFSSPFIGSCINPSDIYVKVPGGSALSVKIREEPNGGPNPETIPPLSFQVSVQLSTTPP